MNFSHTKSQGILANCYKNINILIYNEIAVRVVLFLTMCKEKNFLITLEHHPPAVVGGQHLAREGGSLRRGVFFEKNFSQRDTSGTAEIAEGMV